MSPPLVWVTRAAPGAEATAGRLRAMGFDPLVAPLLEVRRVGGLIDLTGVAALAFTSANGVAAFAARSAERALPVFAVGAATAKVARDMGFADVTSADGDVARLAPVIATHGPFAGAILHAGAAEPARDLVGDLAALGVRARGASLYETIARAPDAETIALIPRLAAVLAHSPKAARVLADHLAFHPEPRLTVLCLSDAVAAPLRGRAQVRTAAEPSEPALLALLAHLGSRAR